MDRHDPKHFFTEEERMKIQTSTGEAESQTIGEIVVIVVGSSEVYAEAEIVGSLLPAGLVSFLLSILFFDSSVWAFLLMTLPAFFLFRRIFTQASRMKMIFVGKGRKEDAVKRGAFAAFHEKGLDRTRQNTGVLFYVSLLERKVWVLADKGIYEKIGQETLNQFAALVSGGIRDGRACSALCEAIRRMGELLSLHFPRTPDDTNELPDAVLS